MALLLRTLVRQGRTLTKLHSLRQHCLVQPTCLISTSKKNEDTSTAVQPVQKKSEELKKLEEHFANTDLEADKVCHNFKTSRTANKIEKEGRIRVRSRFELGIGGSTRI